MKNRFALLCLIAVSFSSQSALADTFTTSLGKVFESAVYPESGPLQGAFGAAWKAPDGTIWSAPSVDTYQNLDLDGTKAIDGIIQKSDATEACAKIGGKLPTFAQYKALSANFTQQEMSGYTFVAESALPEFHKILPGQGEYWTSFDQYSSPANPYGDLHGRVAAAFTYFGEDYINGIRSDKKHVYCVSQ